MKTNYISPVCEIISATSEIFCDNNVSGATDKQGYIVIDSIRDEMPD